jgi:uroporphyrinogen-III synthase
LSALPLSGRSVVVTRTRDQASALVVQLQALGAEVVELPVIAVEDPIDGGRALAAAADRLVAGRYRWVACTSSNAVARLAAALGDRAVPAPVRWAAVGSGTARALEEAGCTVDLVPERSVSEALAAAFPPAGPPDPDGPATVLFPRAETVRGALADGLRAKGWTVDEVVAYRTVAGEPPDGAAAAAARADAVAFTSSSTVTRALDLLGVEGIPPLVVTIGPVTSASARSAGLTVAAEARPHTVDGLVGAVVAAFAGGPGAIGGEAPGHQDPQRQA